MKNITIRLDYNDFKEIYINHPIYIFVGEELIQQVVLETEIKDPTNEEKTIPIQGSLVFTTTLEVEETENVILSFESEVLNNTDWGKSVFDLFLENILEAVGASLLRLKGHYQSYFIQRCYGLSKRYRLVSKEDAVFDLKFCSLTKECPIAGLKYENSDTAYVEEFFRPYNIEKEYQMYKKSVIWDTVGVLCLILLAVGVGLLLDTYRAAAVAVIVLGLSAIIFPIRNLHTAKRQFSMLEKSSWNLEVFVNRTPSYRRMN